MNKEKKDPLKVISSQMSANLNRLKNKKKLKKSKME